MAFKMGMSKEDLSGPPPVPNGVYDLQVTNFKPAVSKSGEYLNYNAEFTVVNHPEYDKRKVFHPLTTGFAVAIADFAHACGVPMEKVTVLSTADTPQHDEYVLPGVFEGQKEFPDDPKKWGKYLGPLTNKVFKAEVVSTEYQGRPKNEVRVFFCAIDQCATLYPEIKHSKNLIKSN